MHGLKLPALALGNVKLGFRATRCLPVRIRNRQPARHALNTSAVAEELFHVKQFHFLAWHLNPDPTRIA